MGIGKISGHRAESLYSGSGICARKNFLHRKLGFQVCSGKCHLPVGPTH